MIPNELRDDRRCKKHLLTVERNGESRKEREMQRHYGSHLSQTQRLLITRSYTHLQTHTYSQTDINTEEIYLVKSSVDESVGLGFSGGGKKSRKLGTSS